MELGASRPGFRSGFVSIVGRPNVGKSTLLNQILRTKVSITSAKPQTTRAAVRGVLTTRDAQIVFVDTPGIHKPRTALGSSLNRLARASVGDVDAALFVVDVHAGVGRGDAFVAGELAKAGRPTIVALNKTDLVHADAVARATTAVTTLHPAWHAIGVSARTGDGIGPLVAALGAVLPEGPMLYPSDAVTDQAPEVRIAELVREKVLDRTRDEVPHSVAVVVDEIRERDGGLVDVDATIYVERSSQKGIVIGRRGEGLKAVGSLARPEIEAVLGSRVYLHLRVKVEPDWQKRAALIERFGYGA